MNWQLIRRKKKQKAKKVKKTGNFIPVLIKKKELTIINQDLIDKLLLYEINKVLDRLLINILQYLSAEEDDAGKTALLFDELSKQRGNILNQYEEVMSKLAIEEYMKKIRFAAFELRKRLVSYEYAKTEYKSR